MAQQEGFSVLAVDAFADNDTQQSATSVYHWPGLCGPDVNNEMSGLMEVLDSFKPDAVLIGRLAESTGTCRVVWALAAKGCMPATASRHADSQHFSVELR